MGSEGCRGAGRSFAVFAGFVVSFLFICILAANEGSSEKPEPNLNMFDFIANRITGEGGGGGPSFHSVSKRRVPSGPDPIHNRRAANCRVPNIRG